MFASRIKKVLVYIVKHNLFGAAIGSETNVIANNDLRSRFPDVRFARIENIRIGERVSIGPEAILAADSPIIIDDDTMIASRAIINTSTHSYYNHPMWKERISRPISIGKHVWIGSSSIILPGVRIGDYAVIGAGSVVGRHVPEKTIVTGNPARIIKYRDLAPFDTSSAYPGVAVYKDYLPDDQICTPKDR